jgi:hypothetical protein
MVAEQIAKGCPAKIQDPQQKATPGVANAAEIKENFDPS